MSKTLAKKKPASRVRGVERTIAAGEFKAKCLKIMDEVNETGRPVIVTKRGEPVIRVVPATEHDHGRTGRKRDNFFGGLKGIIEIVGDPDDLIRPAYALEEYDMFK